VIAEPVSTWVQEIFDRAPRHARAWSRNYKFAAALASPGYQFCTVEYLIVASSIATSSTTARAVDFHHAVARCSLQDKTRARRLGDDQRAFELSRVAGIDTE